MDGRSVNITADTNILVRAAVRDDPEQADRATVLLMEAELIAITLPALCEFVWVLARGYRRHPNEIVAAIRLLLESQKVRVDRAAAEAGIAATLAGGDFADGVIAFEGNRMGGTIFASFDRGAITAAASAGRETRLL